MLIKKGIVTSRESKSGPTVKQGISGKKHSRKVRCASCKAMFEKRCPNELMCEISTFKCPHCGAEIS